MIEIDHTTIKMNSEDNKEYFINWKKHLSHFQNAFDHLFTSNELTDVTLCCEGKKLGAHKILLSACSAYFRETFKEVPCQHPVIILYGVEYSVLSDLLRFIYKGEVSVDTSKLDSFLKLAQHLQISGLTDNCSEQLITESNEHLEATTSSQTPQDTTCTEQYSILMPGDETRKSVKRTVPPTVVEQETLATKIQKQNDNPLLISESDVKCEPDELVTYFEDPLEDPLQSDQTQDMQEFFEDGAGYSAGEEEVKNTLEEAAPGSRSLLPAKSSNRYEKEYQNFLTWCKNKNVEGVNEDVLLRYLSRLSEKFAPNSLWTKVSMLKTYLKLHKNVDISRYEKVFAFLKRKSKCYEPRKAKVLTAEQVTRFLLEAPDNLLLEKVILIFGIFGACRREELLSLCIDNIEDAGRFIIVTLQDSKNKSCRKFTITEDDTPFKGCVLYRTYATLRPPDLQSRRFFIDYRNGKCTRQHVGIHKIGGVPKKIAQFLKLENPGSYTGHSFRRSSATMFAENGGDFLRLKKFGGWKFAPVSE